MSSLVSPLRQRGATLVVGMIMLVLITLMVMAAFNLSTSNLKAVGNMQTQTEAIAATNVALEQVISSSNTFVVPTAQSIAVGDYTVSVAKPVCLYATDIDSGSSADPNAGVMSVDSGGASMTGATSYKNTYWDITATVNDVVSGTSVETHQGVKIALPSSPTVCP